jgi:Domain of unknown function (DUF6265)
MRRLWLAVYGLMLVCRASQADGVDQLNWLAGCWAHEGSEPGSIEMWTTPAAGTLFGVSRTVKNKQAVAHEFMQIRTTRDGIVFIAQPSNQAEASFAAIRTTADEVIFENLQHDFPQRVIYRRVTADSIAARIEGIRDGKSRGIDYPMKRTKCEPAGRSAER